MAPVEEAVLDEVRRRRAEGENGRKDAVSILIEARNEDGSPLSEKELRDELLTLLTDGPTSSSLAWVFERLLRHPEKLARLQEEVLAGEGEAYLDAVIKETLRLRPAGLGRGAAPAEAGEAGRLRPSRPARWWPPAST